MKAVGIATGGAKADSIGFAVVLGLQEEGMRVVIADLYEPCFGALPQCVCIRTDVSDPASVDAMVNQAIEKHGRIDVLVNCVGGSWGITAQDLTAPPPRGFRGLTNCSLEDWRTILGANLYPPFHACRAPPPHLQN